ncbi:transcriptional protein SWT1 isoform X2 [Sphaeramia orbicularis]|uniref:transcriptional protein SWT1 isoform X2 n=1 Tax=Sphaeramia orbicularis TaxID=375764 RepID=UPI00118000B1|nr:transcriptional protein SWT1 isoform X2 [Sphaeramia orbicularis]
MHLNSRLLISTKCLRKMSKKSKKKRRKKSDSSSSDEDEKVKTSKHHHKSKTKKDAASEARHRDHRASVSVRDDSKSTRHIKKPVYRLNKTEATGHRSVHKDEERTKTKHFTAPLQEDNSCRKGKTATVSGSNSVKKGPSQPLKNAAGVLPGSKKTTSERSFDERSSQRSTIRLKTQLMRPSLVSGEQREQKQKERKRKHQHDEAPKTAEYLNPIKTREPSKSSAVSKDSLSDKRKELVKQKEQQRHLEKDMKDKKIPPCTEKSAMTKCTTSKSSSVVSNTFTSVPGNITVLSHQAAEPSSTRQKISFSISSLKSHFKIPKIAKVRPADITAKGSGDGEKHGTEPSYAGTSQKSFKHDAVQPSPYHVDVPPHLNPPNQDKTSSSAGQPPVVCDPGPSPQHHQQVVEELHLARSEKRLEVDVMQSYGELTSMDIDPPEEGATDTQWKQQPQQNLILVLDTNILLSHLNYVKQIISHGCGALGFPVVLIPWVVLQELDALKKDRGLSGSVAHLATPAIAYIYNSVRNREPHLWGQSMQQAAQSNNGLSAENNDDRVLQCCLQYRSLYPECALILCTDDKNLCSKALLSGVKALRKNDLEAEVMRSSHGFPSLQIIQIPMIPHTSAIPPTPALGRSCTTVEPLSQEKAGLSAGKDNTPLSRVENEDVRNCDLSCCFSELENCLKAALSDVLELEMKAAFDNLWLDVVHRKPPWSLLDVLRCMKKHWIAVFGQIVPRKKEKTVEHLIDFFDSGRKLDRDATVNALQESKDLLKAFVKSSSHVPSAISVVENLFHKLQTQGESPASDVVMNDDDEDKQPTCTQVSPQEVWALFETIWSNVCQISLEVFKALGFDPHNMLSVQPVGGPPPPQDAMACLQKLCCVVSQLLQAFSSILSSAPGLVEVQTLLSVIQASEIVDVDKLTAEDLLECFSQQEYREKLSLGGSQLMQMKDALDRCVAFTGQHLAFTSQL